MSPRLFRFIALLLLGLGLFQLPHTAHATITCSQTAMAPVSFGAVNPMSSATSSTATLTYKCTNSGGQQHSAMVCFSIGEPNGGATNPRLMSSGSNTLQFQLWQDLAHTQVWGSSFFGASLTPAQVPITLGGNSSTTGNLTLYATVLGGQTSAAPGAYSDNYQTVDTAVSVNDVSGGTAPKACTGSADGTNFFPFLVTASITKLCTVSASPVLNLGSVAAGTASASGSNSVSISCTNSTPYYVGLSPGNGNTLGQGVMAGQTTGNTTKVPYTLYSNSGLSTVWGNTASSTKVGNGVAGTGNGIAQSLTVYAKTTTTDVVPDTYTDTVTVNVNY